MTEFIDLQRQFRDVSEDMELAETEQLVSLSEYEYGLHFGWSELLKSKRVILLAEAGSGKTREMKEQAKCLVQDGRFAFFVALESLDREPITGILSPADAERFRRWKAGGQEPAWFFLDAVDELKLTFGKLDRALNRFVRDLDGLLGRARVIISCRPSDWRPLIDEAEVEKRLPVPQRGGDVPSQSPEDAFVQVLRRDLGHMSPAPDEDEDPADRDTVRSVAMLPMNNKQIRLFVEGSGLSDAAAFLAEVHSQNAWTFARRPLDLSGLLMFWRSSGGLGTRAKQHETNIIAKLKDDPGRRDRGVLADAKARLGAECLALALALTRTRAIGSPELAPDIRSADGILDAAAILPCWTESERQALLRRALFDPATYGRVRFHHRSVQEYLAARRLRALREQGMSKKALFRLLFAERYGVKVVLPSMRAIAAWLALWADDVRQELAKREPEALLSHGDPETLDLDARSDLVRAFVRAYGQGRRRYLSFWIDDIRRLAHPELAPVIRECWGNEPANDDVRELLLQMIWQAPVKGCADLALAAARNTDWDPYHRTIAIRALLACGCNDSARELADDMLAARPESWPNEIVRRAIPHLFPTIITVGELATLIKERSLGISELRQIVEAIEPGSESASALRDKLADLIWDGREQTQDLYDLDSKFEHLAPELAMLCNRQLSVVSNRPCAALIRASVIASRFGEGQSGRQEPVGKLRGHFDTNSNWRNDAFWAELAFTDEVCPPDDDWRRLRHAEIDGLVDPLVDADRPWLETTLADEDRPERRPVALRALLEGWYRRGRIASELDAIRANLKGDSNLGQILAEYTAPPQRNEQAEQVRRRAQQRKDALAHREARHLENWKKWRQEMLAEPADAFSTEKLNGTLHNLWLWLCAAKPGRARYGLWDKDVLAQAFGPRVAELAEKALRSLWRTTRPLLWSARSAEERGSMPLSWICGLQGLLAEAATQDWTASLSSSEASTAAAYATIELNECSPFISDLTESHPDEVEAVIGGEVSAELGIGGDHPHLPALQHLVHADGKLKQLLIPRLIAELKSWPRDFTDDTGKNWAYHLDQVLHILGDTKNESDRAVIAQECAGRYKADPVGPLAIVWLKALFRFDAVRGAETLLEVLAEGEDSATQEHAVEAFAAIFDRHDTVGFQIEDPDQHVRLLSQLVRHAHAFIRPEDDQVHEGVFEPNTRDDAQHARNYLLSRLLDTPGPKARLVILELAEEKDFVRLSDRLHFRARQRAATDAEFPPFPPKDVVALNTRHEAPPQDRDGLFDLMMDRLEDLQHDLAHGDFSDRHTVQGITDEPEMQRTLARRIREKASGAYLVTREEEVADGNRTDIRLSTTNGDQKVVVEVKIADRRWSFAELERALRDQLVEKYLRHANCKAGCLLLTFHDKAKYWRHPETRRPIKFPELITILQAKAQALEVETQHDVRIAVFGLDLTDPMPNDPPLI